MPDENREFYEFEEEDIKEWFKNNYEGSSPVICPVCKSTDRWGLNSKIPLIELKGISPLFPVWCLQCGYIHFHNGTVACGIKIPRDGGTT